MKTVKIKHFIEANISGCGCNLQCSYCYLRQANYAQIKQQCNLRYPIETIKKACSTERLGGGMPV